jgi:predicted enzyme related to lactoylglutathione lyase
MAGLGDMMVAGVLRAENYDRAKKFYTEVLGLKAEEEAGPTRQGRFWAGEQTMVFIYERPGMPAPENTTLAFGVATDRFDAVLADLRTRGVTFESYDVPEIGLKTIDGIAKFGDRSAAWFKDTEGNVVNVVTM